MHISSYKIVFLLVFLISISLCTKAKAEPPQLEPFIGDQPGGVSSWSDYRGPSFEGYGAIAKDPLWIKVVRYAQAPELVGKYDLEALGRLWIAELHKRVIPNESDKVQKILPLPVSDLPNYLNLFSVLTDFSDNTTKVQLPNTSVQQSSSNSQVTELAIELIKCYCSYYAPIKQFGAFNERDRRKRDALADLVGENAVNALEADYLNAGDRLRVLTVSNLNDFLELKLKQKSASDSLEFELRNYVKELSLGDVSRIDADSLNLLWNSMLVNAGIPELSLNKLVNSKNSGSNTNLFALALGLTRYKDLLETSLVYEQPKKYSTRVPSVSQPNIDALNAICNCTKKLVLLYLHFKLYCTAKPENGVIKAVYADLRLETRVELVKIVGEQAVRTLEANWKQLKVSEK